MTHESLLNQDWQDVVRKLGNWVILVTSLPQEAFSTADTLALYRLRWRIELAFKRLKNLISLRGPPDIDERSARPFVLAIY
jgi:IS4 transposase